MACKQALRGALAEGQERASSTVMLICWEKKATKNRLLYIMLLLPY